MRLKTERKRLIKMAFNRTLKSLKFDTETEKWSFVDDFQVLFNEYLEDDQQIILNEVFTDISSDREKLELDTGENNGQS